MISLLRFSTCYWGGRQGSKFPFCIAITFYDTLLFVVIFPQFTGRLVVILIII